MTGAMVRSMDHSPFIMRVISLIFLCSLAACSAIDQAGSISYVDAALYTAPAPTTDPEAEAFQARVDALNTRAAGLRAGNTP